MNKSMKLRHCLFCGKFGDAQSDLVNGICGGCEVMEPVQEYDRLRGAPFYVAVFCWSLFAVSLYIVAGKPNPLYVANKRIKELEKENEQLRLRLGEKSHENK